MMNTRKIRAMLWLGTACLLVAAVSVVALHFALPAEIESGDAVASTTQHTESTTTQQRVDPANLQRVASKDIRQQLFDPPVQVQKPPPPKPLPPIELISTILGDQGQHRAWVRDGQTLRKIVAGDTLGTGDNPATVERIEVDCLVLQHEGKQVEVNQQGESGGRR